MLRENTKGVAPEVGENEVIFDGPRSASRRPPMRSINAPPQR